ncbi:MAG: GGDEF domain-containing protein [Pseudomonadota bacterium]
MYALQVCRIFADLAKTARFLAEANGALSMARYGGVMGVIETFSADDVTPVDAAGPVGVTPAVVGPADTEPTLPQIDAEQIDAIIDDAKPLLRWPGAIRALYEQEVVDRLAREERFLFLLGLLVCLATILVDMVVNPAMVKEGAILRVLAVAPITLFGLIASARKWHAVASFSVGASPIAFAVVIVHLSLHLPPESSARYLAAAALLMGFANIILPFALRGLVLFNIGYIAAAFAVNMWSGPGNAAHNLDFLVLLTIIACATIPIAHRFERLRQNNFLLNLRARVTSRELLEANERLRALSERDPLTGLPNRRCFERVFEELVEQRLWGNTTEAPPKGRIAVMMIDLDHFKAFNDTHGHQAGDECLRLVGHELGSLLDNADGVAARYGGEEFVAALYEETHGDIGRIAEQVRDRISTLLIPVGPSGRSIVTTSIGVALAPLDSEVSREELIKTADAALYDAKRAGRNRVEAIEIDSPVSECA